MANAKSNFTIGYRPQTTYSEVPSQQKSSASIFMAEKSLLFKDALIKKKAIEHTLKGGKIDSLTAEIYKPYRPDHASTYTAEVCRSIRPKTASLKKEKIANDSGHIRLKYQSPDEIKNQENNERRLRGFLLKNNASSNGKRSPGVYKMTQVINYLHVL